MVTVKSLYSSGGATVKAVGKANIDIVFETDGNSSQSHVYNSGIIIESNNSQDVTQLQADVLALQNKDIELEQDTDLIDGGYIF